MFRRVGKGREGREETGRDRRRGDGKGGVGVIYSPSRYKKLFILPFETVKFFKITY